VNRNFKRLPKDTDSAMMTLDWSSSNKACKDSRIGQEHSQLYQQ
jgi:hypothetical protein